MAAEADRWSRVRDLLADALERAAPDRASFLDGACGGDASLRAEVERLLAAHDGAGGFLEEPAAIAPGAVPETGSPGFVEGARIGRYRIRRRIGAGGMGVVYEGEQEQPHRTVAVKVLRPGIASGSALRRFRREAELLGRLRHPAIAAIYEAGTHADPSAPDGEESVPFFAMELVEGRPLVEHADAKGLDARERVALFVRICDAVEYAHRAGVLHRDLKPGNILVEESGHPKILDFGVARSTGSDLRATTLKTEVGQVVGTLPYMSPEQLAGDPDRVDERSDVFALGVVLYELLARRLPHDLANRSLPEAARILGEEDPTPLSAVDRSFSGDLDTIVGKTLEREKDRRYASAADLADDLRRYLGDRPIAARPASTIYRLRKFAERNRILVAGVGGVFLALVLGIVGTGLGLVRARSEAAKALSVTRLLRRTFGAADPLAFLWDATRAPAGRDTKVVDLLDVAVRELDAAAGEQPEVEAELRQAYGEAYNGLGLWEKAEAEFRRALSIRRRTLGEERAETAETMARLAFVLDQRGRAAEEAERLHRDAIRIFRRILGPEDRATIAALRHLGWGLNLRGRSADGVLSLREALEAGRRALSETDQENLTTRICLTQVLAQDALYAEAETLGRETLEICRRVLGEDHHACSIASLFLGNALRYQGRAAEAEPLVRQAFDGYRGHLGEDHPLTFIVGGALADVLAALGRIDEAEPLYRRSLAGMRREPGVGNTETLHAMTELAFLLERRGEADEAESLLREVLETRRSLSGNPNRRTLRATNDLAWRIKDIGKLEEAEALAREATAGCRQTLGEEDRQTLNTIDTLGVVLRMKGKLEEAESLLRAVSARALLTLGDGDPTAAEFRCHLGECLADLKRFDEAEAELLAAHAALVAAPGARHEATRAAIVPLVRLYESWEKPAEAAEWRARGENPDPPASGPDPTSRGGR